MSSIEDFYQRFCTKRYALPTEEQIRTIEARMQVELPEDFREFLFGYNGGVFSEPIISPQDSDCPPFAISYLLGAGLKHRHVQLASIESLATFEDNEPTKVLPIGSTPMGDLLLLITKPEGRGQIVFKKAWYDQWHFVADGIYDLFALPWKSNSETN